MMVSVIKEEDAKGNHPLIPSLPPSLHPSLDSLRNELQALMEESEDFMPLLAQEGAHAR